jgi:tetratricopeptide (TPR) repeat protein
MTPSSRSLGALTILVATAGSAIGMAQPASHQDIPATRPAPPALVARAYDAAYSLDFDEALALAHQAVTGDPDASQTHRALAAILWLKILFLRGAMTVDYYMGGLDKSPQFSPKPPPALQEEFTQELERAVDLADAGLRAHPHDVQARYDVGAAYALKASYEASVNGREMAAFRAAKRAYDAQEDVLAHDPDRAGARLVVGTYRYLVSGMSLPTRLFAYLVGFGGGKARGISLLEAAAREPGAHVEASVTLLLVYTREGRHEDALRVARNLEAEFPRNRLFVLEDGSAAIRAGHAAEAEATLSRGLAAFDSDPRPKMPGERALWLYTRGMARVNLDHLTEAAADLTAALGADPAGWVRGRIHLELGRVADVSGNRAGALAEYRQARTIGQANGDPVGASRATRLIAHPFTLMAAGGHGGLADAGRQGDGLDPDRVLADTEDVRLAT